MKLFPKKKTYGVKWHWGGLDYDYSYWDIVKAYSPKQAQRIVEKQYNDFIVVMMVKEVEPDGKSN